MLDHGEDTDTEALGLSFHHQDPTFIVLINQVCSRLTIYALKNVGPRWWKATLKQYMPLMNVGPTWWNTTQRYMDYNIHWTQYVLPANIKKVRLKLSSSDSYSQYIIFVSLDIV